MADDKKGAAAAASSPAKKGAADASVATEASPPAKKSRKRLIIILAVLVLLVAGAVAAWFVLGGKDPATEAAEAHDAHHKPNYVPLDPFTVNLADDAGDRMAQISVVLDVTDTKASEAVAAHMPAIRNNILLLISSRQSKELLTVSGKERLARDIAITAGRAIGWTPPPGTTMPSAPPAADAHTTPGGQATTPVGASPGAAPGASPGSAPGTSAVAAATPAPVAPSTATAGTISPATSPAAPAPVRAPAKSASPGNTAAKATKKAEPPKKHPPNPVESVNFAQFIIQ